MDQDDKTVVQFRNADGITQTSRPVAGGFVRPNPGGRIAGAPPPPPPQPSAFGYQQAEPARPAANAHFNSNAQFNSNAHFSSHDSSVLNNALLSAADPLLIKMAELSTRHEPRDALMYREECTRQLQQFEQLCMHQGMGEETRHYARYVLCTVMDELVTKTSWGMGVWSKQSLLSQFHGETGGGERFFQLLEYLQQNPASNIDLLELMFVCLGLGFEGRYSVDARGQGELQNVRDNLFHLIRMQRGEPERDLSPHWQSVTSRRNPLTRYLPLWVVVAVAGVIMLATYSGFSYLLNERSSVIVSQLEQDED